MKLFIAEGISIAKEAQRLKIAKNVAFDKRPFIFGVFNELFVRSKCKRSLLRLQFWMRLFEIFKHCEAKQVLKCQGSSSFSKTRSISFFVEMHGVEQVNKIRLQGLLLDQTQSATKTN